jgi:hypothetical protein
MEAHSPLLAILTGTQTTYMEAHNPILAILTKCTDLVS